MIAVIERRSLARCTQAGLLYYQKDLFTITLTYLIVSTDIQLYRIHLAGPTDGVRQKRNASTLLCKAIETFFKEFLSGYSTVVKEFNHSL